MVKSLDKPMESNHVLPRRARHVTERVVDGELVLYDARRQYVHALNPTAAFIWRACNGRQGEAAISEALAERYPDSRREIKEDVRETLRRFTAAGLLRA